MPSLDPSLHVTKLNLLFKNTLTQKLFEQLIKHVHQVEFSLSSKLLQLSNFNLSEY